VQVSTVFHMRHGTDSADQVPLVGGWSPEPRNALLLPLAKDGGLLHAAALVAAMVDQQICHREPRVLLVWPGERDRQNTDVPWAGNRPAIGGGGIEGGGSLGS